MFRTILLAAGLFAAAPSLAANLVKNGSFEEGRFTDWDRIGNCCSIYVGSGHATDGNYNAAFGSVGSEGGILQSIATTAGHYYVLTFDLQNEGAYPNSQRVTFGEKDVVFEYSQDAFPMTSFRYFVKATGALTDLSFQFRQGVNWYYLDNISLTDFGTSVPEPASWAMMIAGFGLVGGAMRRRATLARA